MIIETQDAGQPAWQSRIYYLRTARHSPIPGSIAIFGASGHIGGPMARYIRKRRQSAA